MHASYILLLYYAIFLKLFSIRYHEIFTKFPHSVYFHLPALYDLFSLKISFVVLIFQYHEIFLKIVYSLFHKFLDVETLATVLEGVETDSVDDLELPAWPENNQETAGQHNTYVKDRVS